MCLQQIMLIKILLREEVDILLIINRILIWVGLMWIRLLGEAVIRLGQLLNHLQGMYQAMFNLGYVCFFV